MNTPELRIEVEYDDPDVIAVEVSVRFAGWSGRVRAYATRAALLAFAAALDGVADGGIAADLAVGQPELGAAGIRVHEYGGARRLGAVVHLREPAATQPGGPQPGGPREDVELRLTVPLERGALPGFAAGLRAIVRDGRGASAVALLGRWP